MVTQALSPNENAFKFGDDKISPSVLDPTATTILLALTSQTEMSLAVQTSKNTRNKVPVVSEKPC